MNQQQQNDVKNMCVKGKAEASKTAKNTLDQASAFISKSSSLKQFAVGSVSGWCTGFLTTRVGKTVALSVGGSVILIVAANQAGFVNVDWDKVNNKVEGMSSKIESKMPVIKTNVSRFGKTNTLFAAGFVGGFLLGLAS